MRPRTSASAARLFVYIATTVSSLDAARAHAAHLFRRQEVDGRRLRSRLVPPSRLRWPSVMLTWPLANSSVPVRLQVSSRIALW